MKWIAVLFLIPVASAFAAEHPVTTLRRGSALFAAGDYGAAASNFAAAAEGAEAVGLDPAHAHYNEGAALLQAGENAVAAERFATAMRSPDLGLQQKAYFNRGNALLAHSGELEESQKLDEAIQAVQEAQSMYENAMALRSEDQDPKVNYELALRRQQELEIKKQEQEQQQQQKDDNKGDEEKDQQEQQQKQEPGEDQEQEQKNEQEKDGRPQTPEQQKQSAGEPQKAEEMTPEEAALLLDAMKKAEESQREKVRLIIGKPVPVDKDW